MPRPSDEVLREWVARALRNHWKLVIEEHWARTGNEWVARCLPPSDQVVPRSSVEWYHVHYKGIVVAVPSYLLNYRLHGIWLVPEKGDTLTLKVLY